MYFNRHKGSKSSTEREQLFIHANNVWIVQDPGDEDSVVGMIPFVSQHIHSSKKSLQSPYTASLVQNTGT